MSGAALGSIGLTVASLAVLLVAEARGRRTLVWITKPLASTGFVVLALVLEATGTRYGRIVLVALLLCWLGDVLLIPKGARRAFLGGLVSFLLGHVAFLLEGLAAGWVLGAALAASLAAGLALRWLWPHVDAPMRGPVLAYVVVISLMVVLAAGATGAGAPALLLIGALTFYVSDLAVARERFVAPGFANTLWGLPLYYASTLVLAASVVR